MSKAENKLSRREEILQALAHMLEVSPGARITTAGLAKEVGFSEAALYRHFPSKSKMFEGLIEFIEETVFTRINLIMADEPGVRDRCEKILLLLLTFTERNPGITRILTGDALQGENGRLHDRVVQFFDRLETQLKQILREAEVREGVRPRITVTASANLMMSAVEGRIAQYVRSEFKKLPTEYWSDQWPLLLSGIFGEVLAEV
ncbi:nucleoid occlusion factor SlmA [Marinibactrum halimedae]|uniref:Nucleoid occlusion factor SlmA n=1 Tax=Marinibactrum halimedae TaxID=1444977 RepID=A0AA37TB16_9GAMM|nr:nucleoid occlusion factor SlmA [Marinibactrum halimedae]MCD9458226.1 nucleoid occlusion factor SlmA [Marinibactrum halimedae]GLS27146.1 nucleoid occlusion factor SlmA [Marinibactrum halimedae]